MILRHLIAAALVLLPFIASGQPATSVSTLADLAAFPGRSNEVVRVRGFYSRDDWGKPRDYVWDPTSTAATNAICIQRWASGSPIATGRWVHDWDGSVTVFGAIPGNHFEWIRYKIGASEPPDCSDAIQAALDYASARPFGRVYFPGGDYRVDKTIYLRAPYGVIIEGVGGSPATLEAVTKGNIVQATRSDLIRNFANGPLFWVIGSTNTTTDPAFTNLQAGVTFNNYVEKIGFRDRYTTGSSGYGPYAFTNTSPLVQFNASVRNHWKWVRFGTAHASHLELFRPDDTHFVECYFDSAGALTNTYSTILWGRYAGDSFYGLNQVFFRACTWETSFGGNVACIGNPGYIVGITIDGMFKTPYGRSTRPALPNLYMKKVQDAKIDLFISGATSFETPTTPIYYTNIIHIDESHNLQMRLNVQNIADGVKATLQDFIYMTNSYASLIDLGTWSSQSRLLGDWVKLDDSCYDIDVRSVGRINQYGSRTVNRPHQFRSMRLIDNGQTWSAGSTNTDAVAITTMPALVGTQDYFYYARVKMPDAAPTTNKYIGGLANILTNQLGGASSTRFYITPSGAMILRQAGTNFSVNTAQTGSYSLWDAFKGEWVDLVFARQNGTNLVLWANGRRTLTGSANYAENLSGELFLHFADDVAGASESQWNYPLAESMLCLGSIDGEKVARLPIDGPPSGTTPLFWYKWGQSPVVEDLTTNKAHAYPYNGVSGSGGRHAPLLSLSKSDRGRIAGPPDGFTIYQTDSTNAGPRWYSTAATNWVTAAGVADP